MLKLTDCKIEILKFMNGRDETTNADVAIHFKKTPVWANRLLRDLLDRDYLTAYAEVRGRGRPTIIYKLSEGW